MSKSYRQYCPIAHALDLVGDRWSLLIVRELLAYGPRRYSDLSDHLEGCGTNILAARLKYLEQHGVVAKRRLPPPAASTVYELTPYGEELRPVVHELAHWGLRSLHPPTEADALNPGWLPAALRTAFPPSPTEACIEFRIGDERASFVGGDVLEGPAADPDAVVESDATGLYHLVVDRDLDAVEVHGRKTAVRELLATLPTPGEVPAPA
jgi:DNA-binding HxlR family transcriptional regulator